jgi:glutaredoxin
MVTVYSRHGCHLCEDAVNILESLRPELDFEIEIIDGEHHDFWRVDPVRFRSSLEKHRQRQ